MRHEWVFERGKSKMPWRCQMARAGGALQYTQDICIDYAVQALFVIVAFSS